MCCFIQYYSVIHYIPPLPVLRINVVCVTLFNTSTYPDATDVTAPWRGTQEPCTTVTKSSSYDSWVTWQLIARPWRMTSITSPSSARARTLTVPSRGALLSCSLGNHNTHTHTYIWQINKSDIISECVCLCVRLHTGAPTTMRTSTSWWWLTAIPSLVTKSHVEACRRLPMKPSNTESKCLLSPSHLTKRYKAHTHIFKYVPVRALISIINPQASNQTLITTTKCIIPFLTPILTEYKGLKSWKSIYSISFLLLVIGSYMNTPFFCQSYKVWCNVTYICAPIRI